VSILHGAAGNAQTQEAKYLQYCTFGDCTILSSAVVMLYGKPIFIFSADSKSHVQRMLLGLGGYSDGPSWQFLLAFVVVLWLA